MNFNKFPKLKNHVIITAAVLFIAAGVFWNAGFLFGFIYSGKSNVSAPESQKEISEIRRNTGEIKYKFINPLLECESIENMTNKKINDIKSSVQDLIDEEINKKNTNFISVYFRDLNNGPWFGINENEKFTPGSLLKVPIMMSVFKSAESNFAFLQKKIPYNGGSETSQYFKPEKEIEAGKKYSVEELTGYMIKYSDNNAGFLLVSALTLEQLRSSYADLGIEEPSDYRYYLPIQTYASFFRILFNATYLNREFSEKALKLLSEATFKKGLRAGVPPGVAVSHKFGEIDLAGDGGKQLHDCGIIYEPSNPYLLCVMTRGNDFEKLSDVIGKISSGVYKAINE